MGFLENELNKRFKNQELSNDQFETEDLWNDIAIDLDKDKKPTAKFLNTKRLSFLFLFAIGISSLLFFYNQSNNLESISGQQINQTDNKNDQNRNSNLETSIDKSSISNNSTSLSANENSDDKIANGSSLSANEIELINNTNDLQLNDRSTRKASNSKKDANIKTSLAENTQLQNKSRMANPEFGNTSKTRSQTKQVQNNRNNFSSATKADQNNDKSDIPVITNRFENNNSPKPSSKNELLDKSKPLAKTSQSQEGNSMREKLPFLESLSNSTKLLALKDYQKPVLKSELFSNPKTEKIESKTYFISAMTGVNILDYHFSSISNGDLAELKNHAEKLFTGSSYGLYAGKKFRNYNLSTGIEYHQLWSKFDFKSVKLDSIVLDSVLLKEWRDAETGELINAIYGDATNNVTETRTVRHYNNIQRFSVPLQFGFHKQKGKINYALDLGPVFNFTIAQSGRTINSTEQIVDFDGTAFPSPFKSFDISVMISPSLGIDISESWQLMLNPQWRWSQSKNFTNSDFKIGKNQFNFNVGLKYNLGS